MSHAFTAYYPDEGVWAFPVLKSLANILGVICATLDGPPRYAFSGTDGPCAAERAGEEGGFLFFVRGSQLCAFHGGALCGGSACCRSICVYCEVALSGLPPLRGDIDYVLLK